MSQAGTEYFALNGRYEGLTVSHAPSAGGKSLATIAVTDKVSGGRPSIMIYDAPDDAVLWQVARTFFDTDEPAIVRLADGSLHENVKLADWDALLSEDGLVLTWAQLKKEARKNK